MRWTLHAVLIPVALFLLAGSALGIDQTYYDATNSIIDRANPVGTKWHELYPNYCIAPFTITDWKDNGDGILSPCDTIVMQGPDLTESCEHVVEVTYTLELTPLQDPIVDTWWDFTEHSEGLDPLENPVCSFWVEIHPDFGITWHIDYWEDNGSGRLDSCDVVVDDTGLSFHVEGVHTDIVTEPTSGCPIQPSTWSTIKDLFR